MDCLKVGGRVAPERLNDLTRGRFSAANQRFDGLLAGPQNLRMTGPVPMPTPPWDNRDAVFGRYMDCWSRLENQLFFLFWVLAGTEQPVARYPGRGFPRGKAPP